MLRKDMMIVKVSENSTIVWIQQEWLIKNQVVR